MPHDPDHLAHLLGALAEAINDLPSSDEEHEVSVAFLRLADFLVEEGLVPEHPDR